MDWWIFSAKNVKKKIGLGVYISSKKSYSKCKQIEPTNSAPLAAEAHAVYYALEKACFLRKNGEICEKSIIIHSDCKSVVEAMNGNIIPKVTFKKIFKKIRDFADKNFDSVEYIWVRRSGNKLADNLAKKALKLYRWKFFYILCSFRNQLLTYVVNFLSEFETDDK